METNKNIIRINETQLKQMISEGVKKVLKEGCWYGDEKPFIDIINATTKIMEALDYVNNDDYEESGDDYSYSQLYKWAYNVHENAQYYLTQNSSYTSINCGEDW